MGLLSDNQGAAASALVQLGVTLPRARRHVEELIGRNPGPPAASPAFTARVKKVLELSLREAHQLGHNDIGTEHLLLGLLREGQGAAVRVLSSLGADPRTVRQTVLQLVGAPSHARGVPDRWSPPAPAEGQLVRCSFCRRQPPESGRLVRGRGAYICERCVDLWHRKLTGDAPVPGPQPPTERHGHGRTPGEGAQDQMS